MDSQTRFNELKAKGYTNLEGEERKEYSRLKAELKGDASPKMVDHVVTQEDLNDNPDLASEGVKVGDTIQVDENDIVSEKKEESPKESAVSATEQAAKTDGTGQFVMTRNVNDWPDEFKKDQPILATHPKLKKFLELGYAREKTIS